MGEEDFFSFGPFRMNLKARILLRDGRRVPLRRVLVDLLLVFIEHRHEDVLTYDFLVEKVWKGEASNESVSQAVSELRRRLSDIREEYIETIRDRGYRFAPHPYASRALDAAAAPAVDKTVRRNRAVAVLPFQMIGPARDRGVIGAVVTDALITRLGSLENVRVPPLGTVQRLQTSTSDPLSIGRALQVDTIVDGSVQTQDNRIRITARLFSVDGSSLGSTTLDEIFTDIFSIQDSISRRVSYDLGLEPTQDEERLFMKRYTQNTYAYECYLMGREHWNKRTVEELNTSIDFFRKALAEDPNYVLPYVGIADAYTLLGTVAFSEIPPCEVMPKARDAVRAALSLDDSLPEVHTSQAFIKTIFDWNWNEAQESFRRAFKLNPGYAPAHHWYAHLLLAKGRWNEALEEIGRALELDPISPMVHSTYGWMLHLTRSHEKAVKHLQKTLALHPYFSPAHTMLGLAYEAQGFIPEALEEFTTAAKYDGGPTPLAAIGHAHAISGNKRGAGTALQALRKMARARYVSPYFPALIHAGLGETDQAIEQLEQALDEGCDWLIHLTVEPRWDVLRELPGFIQLLKLTGLA
jgi:DNA-binding winged helix-turn-helix (wHTH) protein/tetratricopeptide (TPR) repeat protein